MVVVFLGLQRWTLVSQEAILEPSLDFDNPFA